VEEKFIKDIIRCLSERFGKESPLTTSRGKVLVYLGLTLDYSVCGRVKFSMYEYVKKLVEEAPEDMTGVTKTPQEITCSQPTQTATNYQRKQHRFSPYCH